MVSVWDNLYMVSGFLRNCPGKALSAPDPSDVVSGAAGSCTAQCHDLTSGEYGYFQCITKPLANCQQVELQTFCLVVSLKSMPCSFTDDEFCEESLVSSFYRERC